MASLSAILLAAAAAVQDPEPPPQDAPEVRRTAIQALQNENPDFELQLPEGYSSVSAGSLPPAHQGRFRNRFWRKAGEEDWQWVRIVVHDQEGVLGEEAFADPTLLGSLVYAPERDGQPVTNIQTLSGTEKHGRLTVRRLEARFDQELSFLALAAVYEIYPRSFSVIAVAPASPELEAQVKEDLERTLSTAVVEYPYLTREELEAGAGKARTFMIAAIVLSVLYPVVWAVFFRGLPQRLHWLRVLWLAAAAAAWGALGTSAYPLTTTMQMMELPIPLLFHFFIWIPMGAVFGIACILKVLQPKSAFTWA